MEDGDSGLSAPEKDEKDVDVVALSDVALLEQLGYKVSISPVLRETAQAERQRSTAALVRRLSCATASHAASPRCRGSCLKPRRRCAASPCLPRFAAASVRRGNLFRSRAVGEIARSSAGGLVTALSYGGPAVAVWGWCAAAVRP